MNPFFSILVVCLNAGDKLKTTIDSILRQSFTDYEIVVKDGGSTDGSLAFLQREQEENHGVDCETACRADGRIRILVQKDCGIYDAMNQAAQAARGKYVYYLNCGDVFYDDAVLQRVHTFIVENPAARGIYYGNIRERLTGQEVASNPNMDAFGCYRNVPCHQACFYDRELLMQHPFDTSYAVRADYEQFLWCFFAASADESGEQVKFFHGDIRVCDYEGGGFSETKENRRRSAAEHKEIVAKYMTRGQVFKYRAVMLLTLAPLRTRLAENKMTARMYQGLKKMIYRR